MFGALKSLFTPEATNKVVDGIYNGIDKICYTDEEKAECVQKRIDTKLKMLPLFEPFKLAQRIIATTFTINFVLWVWTGIVIYIVCPDRVDGFIHLLGAFWVGEIMLAIIGWYFTGGVINSFKKGSK